MKFLYFLVSVASASHLAAEGLLSSALGQLYELEIVPDKNRHRAFWEFTPDDLNSAESILDRSVLPVLRSLRGVRFPHSRELIEDAIVVIDESLRNGLNSKDLKTFRMALSKLVNALNHGI